MKYILPLLMIFTSFEVYSQKNEDNKYIFLINDIAYYEGESLITKNFEYRHSIIEKIMNNNYELDEDLYLSLIHI